MAALHLLAIIHASHCMSGGPILMLRLPVVDICCVFSAYCSPWTANSQFGLPNAAAALTGFMDSTAFVCVQPAAAEIGNRSQDRLLTFESSSPNWLTRSFSRSR